MDQDGVEPLLIKNKWDDKKLPCHSKKDLANIFLTLVAQNQLNSQTFLECSLRKVQVISSFKN